MDRFRSDGLPRMRDLPTPVVLSVAGVDAADFEYLAARVEEHRDGVAALELNPSFPNVSKGLDFGRAPEAAARVVAALVQPLTAQIPGNDVRGPLEPHPAADEAISRIKSPY